MHGLKVQTSTLPNGMTFHAFPPTSVRAHDSKILNHSGVLTRLREIQLPMPYYVEHGILYQLHGDPAYIKKESSPVLSSGGLGDVRISEEHNYAILKGKFSLIDFKRMLKLKKNPVAKIIFTALILTNAHVCLNDSHIGQYYHCSPPTLHDYTHKGKAHVQYIPDHGDHWVYYMGKRR